MKYPKNYNCTQNELYAVCAQGWEVCNQNIAAFTAFKPKYNAAFVQERKDEIGAVMRLADNFKRSAAQELLRLTLSNEANKCLVLWRMLKSYIEEAWPGVEQSAMLKSAGISAYREAYKYRWEACMHLVTSAEIFAREQEAVLSAGNNMPENFISAISEQQAAYKKAYDAFLDSLNKGSMLTRDKVDANNKLYKELNSMFSDARILFKGQETLLKQFSFKTMLNQISGPGTAGIKGFIAGLPEPVDMQPGLEMKLLESGKEAMLESDGAYRFSQIAAGAYTLQLKADGYQTLSIPVNVNTGSFTLLNLVMEPEARV